MYLGGPLIGTCQQTNHTMCIHNCREGHMLNEGCHSVDVEDDSMEFDTVCGPVERDLQLFYMPHPSGIFSQ